MGYSRKDFGMVAKFAAAAHSGQLDVNGAKYIGHPARVAKYALSLSGGDWELASAAILHDVVEDCGIPLPVLAELLGLSGRVVGVLSLVTRDDSESYEEFIDRIANSGNMDAVAVKLCDLKDNTDPNRPYKGDAEKGARLAARYKKAIEKLENVYLGR